MLMFLVMIGNGVFFSSTYSKVELFQLEDSLKLRGNNQFFICKYYLDNLALIRMFHPCQGTLKSTRTYRKLQTRKCGPRLFIKVCWTCMLMFLKHRVMIGNGVFFSNTYSKVELFQFPGAMEDSLILMLAGLQTRCLTSSGKVSDESLGRDETYVCKASHNYLLSNSCTFFSNIILMVKS